MILDSALKLPSDLVAKQYLTSKKFLFKNERNEIVKLLGASEENQEFEFSSDTEDAEEYHIPKSITRHIHSESFHINLKKDGADSFNKGYGTGDDVHEGLGGKFKFPIQLPKSQIAIKGYKLTRFAKPKRANSQALKRNTPVQLDTEILGSHTITSVFTALLDIFLKKSDSLFNKLYQDDKEILCVNSRLRKLRASLIKVALVLGIIRQHHSLGLIVNEGTESNNKIEKMLSNILNMIKPFVENSITSDSRMNKMQSILALQGIIGECLSHPALRKTTIKYITKIISLRIKAIKSMRSDYAIPQTLNSFGIF